MNEATKEIIRRTSAGSIDGTMSFPDVVQCLMEVGVSFYHIDLLRSEKTCYLKSGESMVEPLDLPDAPISIEFNAQGVADAVRDSQLNNQAFVEFIRRAKLSGCIGYFAYLDGRKVVYGGRLGDEHVEHFPN